MKFDLDVLSDFNRQRKAGIVKVSPTEDVVYCKSNTCSMELSSICDIRTVFTESIVITVDRARDRAYRYKTDINGIFHLVD